MLCAFSLGNLENLPVDHVGAAKYAAKRQHRNEDASGSHPAIQIKTDEKTETNASGHGKADLKNDGGVLSPMAVFLVVEQWPGLSGFKARGVARKAGRGQRREETWAMGATSGNETLFIL
jgi:hypothetical protein